MNVARGVGLVEPVEDRLSVAETDVHERHCVGRHVPIARHGFQRSQHVASLFGSPWLRKEIALKGEGFAVAFRKAPRFVQRFQTCCGFAKLFIRLRELHVANPELRVDDGGLPCVLHSCRIVAGLEGDLRRECVLHRLERIQLARTVHHGACLLVSTHLREENSQPALAKRVARIEFDRPPHCRFRPSPIPVEQEADVSSGGLHLCELGLRLNRPRDSVMGARPDCQWRRIAVDRTRGIRVGKPGPGERIVRIERNRTFVVANSARSSLTCAGSQSTFPSDTDRRPRGYGSVAAPACSGDRAKAEGGPTILPPILLGSPYPAFVPKTDVDGNDIAGIRLPEVAVPLATYTGWGLRAAAFAGDDLCDMSGQKIDFSQTMAERLAIGDPRLSIEERYPNHGSYVSAVAHAANRLHQARLLLDEDLEAYIEAAANSTVGK